MLPLEEEKLAQKVATKAHEGQFRWDGKTPYISHPAAVAKILKDAGFDGEYVAAAWLHDVVEDCEGYTLDTLREAGFSKGTVKAVELLTKGKDENYLQYILNLKDNETARRVKIADINHNMSTLGKTKGAKFDKYQLALYILGCWVASDPGYPGNL